MHRKRKPTVAASAMFLACFALCLRLDPAAGNLSVMVGAVSTDQNPLWSQRIPGIHTCEDDDADQLMEVRYSYMERRLVIPDEATYTHCRVALSRGQAKYMRSLAVEGAFLRFYVGSRTFRAKFARVENGVVKYATRFVVVVDDSKPVLNPAFRVEAGDFVEIKEGVEVAFKFSVTSGKVVVESIESDWLWLVWVGCSGFVLALLVSLYLVYYSRKESQLVVPLAEIWRIQNRFRDSLLISSAGLMYIAVGICLTRYCPGKREVGPLIQHALAMVIVAPLQLTVLLAKTVGVVTDETNYVSLALLYYIFIMMPQTAFTVLFGFFGSFRGYRIRWIAVNDPVFLLAMMVICRGWGRSGYLMNTWFSVETTGGKSNFPLKGRSMFAYLFNIAYVVAGIVSVFPACMHMVNIYYEDAEIDWKLLWACVFAYGGLAAVTGIIRTAYRVGRLTSHWSEGHMLYNSFVGIGAFVAIAKSAIRKCVQAVDLISRMQVLLGGLSIAWAVSGIAMSIGVFFSYVWSFVTMLIGFSQRKSS